MVKGNVKKSVRNGSTALEFERDENNIMNEEKKVGALKLITIRRSLATILFNMLPFMAITSPNHGMYSSLNF